jgi:GNAT superfamily N-acetyltransferase
MSVSIRLAQVADTDRLVRLTAQLGYDITTAEASARLQRVLERPDQRFFVADDGGPVGWLHAVRVEYFESGACVVINGLVVDSDCRGAGVGRLLLQQAEQWAREEGVGIVRVWSSDRRHRAHRFYAREGYEIVKTQLAFVKPVDREPRDLSGYTPRVQP